MSAPILLLTRPTESSTAFHASLAPEIAARAQVIVSPLLRIVGTGAPVDLAGIRGVILTSAQAVRFAPDGGDRPAYCVGEATAAAARARGWDVRQVSATAEELLAELPRIEGLVIHLGGRHLRMDIAGALRDWGMDAVSVPLYDQELCPLSDEAQAALSGGSPVVAPLFSLRTASHLVAQAAELGHTHAVAISPAVSEVLPAGSFASVQTVPSPSAGEMRRAVEKLLSGSRLS
ncbi:uroporphyrinogen-III synthase [Sulfitobacter alexandrii]|nr:uroporphyrinogen-III synthase [Sulfitobacter alexandrii]